MNMNMNMSIEGKARKWGGREAQPSNDWHQFSDFVENIMQSRMTWSGALVAWCWIGWYFMVGQAIR